MTGGSGAAVFAGSAASRARREGDDVRGVRPSAVFAPRTADEAASIVAECSRDRRALVFAGGRTDMDLGAPPSRLDAVVETGGLARILEHAPSDQIVVVEAGVTIAALQARLAERGQRLALDPPSAGRATVGGVIAANAFGPLRASAGSVRDLLIGVSFVRADGIAVRGGGKVVKNVAGFDLPKLMVGSLGTLGMITTATFRLHPIPETSATVLFTEIAAAGIDAIVTALRDAALEPASVVAISVGTSGRFEVAVRFEGFAAGVAEQRDRVAALLPDRTRVVLDAAAASAFSSRHDAVREGGPVRLKLAAPRNAAEAVMARAFAPLAASGGASAEANEANEANEASSPRIVWYPTVGLGFFASDAGDPDRAVAAIGEAREALLSLGGSLVVCAAPPAVASRVDVWGPPPASLPLMQAMKARFDPDHLLAPGRFVGGI